eukprot:scaffold6575_cov120-Isochrysis_galbana.AAC.1
MERWYHYDPRDGTGLGKREQGILLPIDPAPTAFTNRLNNQNSPKRPPRADVRVNLTVESKVVHEVNKPRRDEPAACTFANISLTTG